MTTRIVRERLLDAGVQTFSKAGFNGCSVQDITEAAGVPKGSFYNHFESKEALGAAALRHFWADGGACQRLEALAKADGSPSERLRQYFEGAVTDMAAVDFTCGCLIGNMAAEQSDHSPAIAAELSAIFTSWTRRVADCIRAAQVAGELKSQTDPEVLATFVLNAWEGALLRARIEKGERPLRQFIDVLFTQLLH